MNKSFKTFSLFNRNMGIILSGDKGMGKSLFAKALSNKAVENDIPVIIVEEYIKGIASYLGEIEQEVMVVFDEFDKTFSINKKDNDNPQDDLLTLLDGFGQGKKLFVITCNNINSLNDYFINRTGRFHYHFRFEYPNAEEVRTYLEDKMVVFDEIEARKVINFSTKVRITYDSLRAIVFELNNGENFESCIKDLNIIKISDERYDVEIYFEDGKVSKIQRGLSLFDDVISFDIDINRPDYMYFNISFKTDDMLTDYLLGHSVINREHISITDYIDKEDRKEINIDKVIIKKQLQNSMRYLV